MCVGHTLFSKIPMSSVCVSHPIVEGPVCVTTVVSSLHGLIRLFIKIQINLIKLFAAMV